MCVDYKLIGGRVKERRKAHGMTQDNLPKRFRSRSDTSVKWNAA